MDELTELIEERIAELDPRVELIALERPGPEALRLFIDHPDGVGLDLCERVTHRLGELQADYALEVSSPGLDRPLTKPDHYRRFVGSEVKVRTVEPIDGQRNFTGELAEAGESAFTVDEPGGGRTEIPFELVRRTNLVPEPLEVTS